MVSAYRATAVRLVNANLHTLYRLHLPENFKVEVLLVYIMDSYMHATAHASDVADGCIIGKSMLKMRLYQFLCSNLASQYFQYI